MPLLHDVKAINSNKANILKMRFIWFSCNVTFPWRVHGFKYKGFSGVMLSNYGVKGCVQTLLVEF